MLVFRVDAAADNRFLYLVKFVIENGLRVICKILMWSSDGLSVGSNRFGFLDLFRLNICDNVCLISDSSSESEARESDDVDDVDDSEVEMVPGIQSYAIFGFLPLIVASVGVNMIFDGMYDVFFALYLSAPRPLPPLCGAT